MYEQLIFCSSMMISLRDESKENITHLHGRYTRTQQDERKIEKSLIFRCSSHHPMIMIVFPINSLFLQHSLSDLIIFEL